MPRSWVPIPQLEALLETTPAILAHDLHPDYLSTR